MKYHKILVLASMLALVGIARAEVAPEKRVEIDKLLRLTGTEKLMEQVKSQMVTNFKASMPGVPAGFWDKVYAKMDIREFMEKIIPIYDKYYTMDDLRAINGFYSSPAGQKIIATLPQVMHESMVAGQEWGKKVAQDAIQELADEKKANQAPDAAPASGTPPAEQPARQP
jgi:uncharacterized protein